VNQVYLIQLIIFFPHVKDNFSIALYSLLNFGTFFWRSTSVPKSAVVNDDNIFQLLPRKY